MAESWKTWPISRIKAALKDFEAFPADARPAFLTTLTIAADGARRALGDAFRVVYSVQRGDEILVIHAFRKKSKQGIRTPKYEIDLVKDRLKRLKEALR